MHKEYLVSESVVSYLRCVSYWPSHHATSSTISSTLLGALLVLSLFFLVLDIRNHRLSFLIFIESCLIMI